MKPSAFDVAIDRFVIPIAAIVFVVPALYAWHFYAQRVNARQGRR